MPEEDFNFDGFDDDEQSPEAAPPASAVEDGKPSPAAMRWVAGCAFGIFIFVAVLGTGVWNILLNSQKEEDKRIEILKSEGFEIIKKNGNISIEKDINHKTLYKTPGTVTILANCKAEIYIIAKSCNVSGDINSTLTFYGDQITIGQSATVKVLEGKGKIAFINGKVDVNHADFASTMNQANR